VSVAQRQTVAPPSSVATGVRELTVVAVERLTDRIVHFAFESPGGGVLSSYEPGSHLIVHAGDVRNTYSLVGDGVNPRRYEISVLRRGGGGGSDWLHDTVRPGMTLTVEGPRSLFAPHTSETKALLVAGGIGVTPILSHARAAARWKRAAEVVYVYRPGSGAHLGDLRALAETGAISLFETHNHTDAARLLAERLSAQPMGTHAYACGPVGLLDTYLELGRQAGWPSDRLHSERFEVPAQRPGVAFHAVVASTGTRIEVPAGVSLLDTLLEAGLTIPNLCRRGVCGECRIPVTAGVIEHRDYVLTDREKKDNTTMLCCVSRGQEIEVDL
jgi:ferredoxin-NADP reductase